MTANLHSSDEDDAGISPSENKRLNSLATDAARIWRERNAQISHKKRLLQAESEIPLDLVRKVDELQAEFENHFRTLQTLFDQICESLARKHHFTPEFYLDDLLQLLELYAIHPTELNNFAGLAYTTFDRKAKDQLRSQQKHVPWNRELATEVASMENSSDESDWNANRHASAIGQSAYRVPFSPTVSVSETDAILQQVVHEFKDPSEFEMLLFVAGIQCKNAVSQVYDFEAKAFHSKERRYFAEKEYRTFQYANPKLIWLDVKRKYWQLLRSPSVWKRVVYPLNIIRDKDPELFEEWRGVFTSRDLGSVAAAIITGGWIFYDSGKDWWETMEESAFRNLRDENNFLAVSMKDSKNAMGGRGNVLSSLNKLYTGREDLNKAWENWKAANTKYWQHICSIPDKTYAREILKRQNDSQDDLTDFGVFDGIPLPMTSEMTRSYLWFADLPFENKYHAMDQWKNLSAKNRAEQLTFMNPRTRRRKSN